MILSLYVLLVLLIIFLSRSVIPEYFNVSSLQPPLPDIDLENIPPYREPRSSSTRPDFTDTGIQVRQLTESVASVPISLERLSDNSAMAENLYCDPRLAGDYSPL